ncbi:MAG: phenylalanine--tRNA ligase subunit beta, partial [Planctomycetota bacterium]
EQMVVIADAERAVAIGGVMGGAETEVSETTTDLLIESARFRPLSIRRTARKLKLHSPSSYRFERSPDPAGIDWASRRCCQLIAEVAGGEVLDGAVVGGDPPPPRESIGLRYSQIPRVLGIEVPRDQSEKILVALGCSIQRRDPSQLTVVPPTWRIDLTREADLIEEVARIHGYDQIPEDVAVPIGTAMPRPKDRVLELVRRVLIARGIDEAMTPSVTPESLERLGSPWTDRPPLTTETQMLVGAKCLRRSLLPSLLQARRYNQAQSLRNAELYEVATIFLPGEDPRALPQETCALGIVAKGDLRFIKGIVEEILSQVAGRNAEFGWNLADVPLMARGTALHIQHSDRTVGFVGLMAPETGESLDLDGPAAVAELSVDVLTELLVPVRTATAISPYPAVARDLNFIVDEKVRWAQIAAVCRESGTELLRDVEYRETYRDPQKDGPGKKRILLTLYFQSMERTLTSDEVDAAVNGVIRSCQSALQARLLAG